ncbi:uncharacterized protein [Pyrus communis]|uniref:uncharacterized protein n=1 Tax=Pyrus communis TaxID=23211 RepID=UPI0035C15A77
MVYQRHAGKEERGSFLDAYSGYNQIAMYEAEKEKTVFVIERDTYCYKWEINLVESMLSTTGGRGMMIMATDYSTKWVEVKPMTTTTQAEASNKMILDYLKKSFSDKKGKWPDELPKCLWEYHTTKRRATSETLFSLAFGSKAIIPPNVIMPSINTLLPSIEQNNKENATSLDLTKEKCDQTITHIAAYQQ